MACPLRQTLNAMKILPFIASWLLGAGSVVWAGSQPNPFAHHIEGQALSISYPLQGVAIAVSLVTLELVILWVIIRKNSYKESVGRAFLALLGSLAFSVLGLADIMHAPPYVFHYIWWTFAMSAALLLFLGWSVLSVLVAWLSGLREPHGA